MRAEEVLRVVDALDRVAVRYWLLNGATFVYPRIDLVAGSIAGRDVPCISVRLQREFHMGYKQRHQDLHDLGVLNGVHAHSP